jgi:Protein of unknown function DUF262
MAEFKLTDLVVRVDQDKLVIPDFQRGFKWQTPDIRKLLESLLLDFPIGAALLWRTQRTTLDFRRIEEVEFSDDETEGEDNSEPHEQELRSDEIDFILDGQQRITSIYKGPSEKKLNDESVVIQGMRPDSRRGRRCGRPQTARNTIVTNCAIRAT